MSKDRVVSTGSRIKEEDRIKEDRFKEQGERIKTGLRIKGKTRKMKDSGVEWIGEIPEDWEIVKIKNVYKNPKEIVGNKVNLFKRLSLTLRGVIKRPKEDAKGLQPERFEGYQILKKGQLVFKLIDLENINTSRVGLSPYVGLVSPAYIILDNEKASKYGYYFFLSMWHRQIFNQLGGDGVRSSIGPKDLLNFPYVLASYDEQEKIANFLDEKVSLIDYTIEKTKQSIEDYKKYKQALITETVTKGLNPDVEMKDSGIEWIGEIPEHWKRTRLKRVLLIPITDGPHETPKLLDGGFPFISAEAIKNNKINFNLRRGYISEEDHKIYSKKCKPQLNDIFMVKSGATTGNVAIVETDEEFSIWSPLALIRCNDKSIYYKYLFYYLQSDIFQRQVQQFWNYGTQQNIGMNVLENLFVSFPDLREQKQIADYLDKKCSEIDKVITKKEKLIKDLEIYKKSLIYEYVTGKKRVV